MATGHGISPGLSHLVLLELEARGHDSPLPIMQLLKLLNSASCKDIYDTNLHTLHRNGLLQKYRNASMNLAFTLTETGRWKAAAIRYELVL